MARNSGQLRRRIKGFAPPIPRHIAVRLTTEEFERLKRAADRRETPLPNFLRRAALALANQDEAFGGVDDRQPPEGGGRIACGQAAATTSPPNAPGGRGDRNAPGV